MKTQEQTQHTPYTLEGAAVVHDGKPVYLVSGTPADAAFLLRAVNAHDDLVEALESDTENITRALECGDCGDWANAEIFLNNQRGIAQAALAKAKGE